MGNATYFRCRYFTAYSFGCMAVVAWCGISSVLAQAPVAPPTEGGAGSGGGVALGAEEAPQDTSDVRAILAKVRAEYEGIYAYRMTIKWHQRQFPETSLHLPLPLGELLSEGEGEWIEDGARWRVHQWRRNQQTYLMMGKPMTPAKRIRPFMSQTCGLRMAPWCTESKGMPISEQSYSRLLRRI